MPPINLIDDNIDVLSSSLAILGDLSDDNYQKSMSPYFSASIGKHMRHILDHYLRFFDGLDGREIDYDNRARDEQIETDLNYCLNTIGTINQRLEQLKSELEATPKFTDQPLQIKLCTSTTGTDTRSIASSLERELIFVHGHTTHHYAIIAAMLKMLEVPVNADFGVAPSTLVYEQGLECAP